MMQKLFILLTVILLSGQNHGYAGGTDGDGDIVLPPTQSYTVQCEEPYDQTSTSRYDERIQPHLDSINTWAVVGIVALGSYAVAYFAETPLWVELAVALPVQGLAIKRVMSETWAIATEPYDSNATTE